MENMNIINEKRNAPFGVFAIDPGLSSGTKWAFPCACSSDFASDEKIAFHN